MKLGGEYESLKEDLAGAVKSLKQVITSFMPRQSQLISDYGTNHYEIRTYGRALAEKIVMVRALFLIFLRSLCCGNLATVVVLKPSEISR